MRFDNSIVCRAAAWMVPALSLIAWSGSSARAAVIHFTVDPSQSSLTFTAINNDFIPITLTAQQAGSLTDSFTGSILADVSGTTINQLDGSLDADEQGPFIPNEGNYENNYGYIYSFSLFNETRGYFGDLVLSLSGGASGQALGVTSGVNVYTGPLLAIFEESLVGLSGTNAGSAASLVYNGSQATLTIPTDVEFALLVDTVEVRLQFVGTIVATALVPEPSTWALMGWALAPGLVVLGRRLGCPTG